MAFAKKNDGPVLIAPAKLQTVKIPIVGTAPLVQNKFSNKAREQMMDTMSTARADRKSKAERAPRDFQADFVNAQHMTADGRNGIPAPAFRSAMIDACRVAGVVMTRAKMSVFVIADGFDAIDGTPLVYIKSVNPPERIDLPVRNESGVADIRARPMWREWSADVRVTFDADQINVSSVMNLLNRAGLQVGVGEGRPFSKNSNGQGWGTFKLVEQED